MAFAAGEKETRVGGVVSTPPLVNGHWYGAARAFPASSRIATESLAVKPVTGCSGPVGEKVAVAPAHVTVPGTGAPSEVRTTVKVVPVTLVQPSWPSNVAEIVAFVRAPEAPLGGTVEITEGGVVSVPAFCVPWSAEYESPHPGPAALAV